MSIVVLCDDQAELDRYWNALLEGGGKAQACGWLIDRFGLRWQIVPTALDEMMRDTDPARSKRVTDAPNRKNCPSGWPRTPPYAWWRLHDEHEPEIGSGRAGVPDVATERRAEP